MNEPQSCPMRTCGKTNVNDFRRWSDDMTHGFGGTNVVKKSGEVIRELLERVFLRFVGFVGPTISQHVRCDDAVASLNPRSDLVFPGSPERR